MAKTPVLPTARRVLNTRAFGWLDIVLGAIFATISLLCLALFAVGRMPGGTFGLHDLFMAGGPGVLGTLMVAEGVVRVRTNRQSAAIKRLSIAGWIVWIVGLFVI